MAARVAADEQCGHGQRRGENGEAQRDGRSGVLMLVVFCARSGLRGRCARLRGHCSVDAVSLLRLQGAVNDQRVECGMQRIERGRLVCHGADAIGR